MANTKKPREKDRVYVALELAGFSQSPDVVTNELGIEPSDYCKVGEYRVLNDRKIGLPANENKWSFDSRRIYMETDEIFLVEAHTLWMLDELRPHKNEVRKVADSCEDHACLAVVGSKFSSYNIAEIFYPSMLQDLADMGLTLYIDFYNYSDDASLIKRI